MIVGARFEPTFARDGDQVVLTVEADEPIAGIALAFAGGVVDPGFALEGAEADDERRFTLSVDENVPEGTYDVALVSLVDASGNEARSFPRATLVIDRSAPTLRNVEVDGGPFSDLPGQNIAPVLVDASEPLEIVATLGDQAANCIERPDSALGYVCEVALDTAQDGANVGLLRGVDAAGNEVSASFSVDVDVAAPDVVPGTLSFVARAPSGAQRENGIARAGDRLELSFVAREPLGPPPSAELFTGARTPFVIDDENAQVFAMSATVPANTSAGTHVVDLELVDVAGHISTIEVATIDIAAVVPPRCPLVVEGELRCADNDGDGHLGRPLDCPECPCAEDDCDDEDPTINPTALERFVDTAVNSCGDSAPTLPLIHVDTNRPGGGTGSAAEPFSDLAFVLGLPGDAIVLLAAGDHGIGGNTVTKSIYGGYSEDFTSRSGRSKIVGNVRIEGAVILEGLEFTGELEVGAAMTLIDVSTPSVVLVDATIRVIDSELLGGVNLGEQSTGSRFINVNASELTSRADVTFVGGALGELDVEGARAVIVNTLIEGSAEPLIDVVGAEVELVHCVVNSDSGIVFRLESGDRLDLFGSIVRTEQTSTTLFCGEFNGDGIDCNGTVGDDGFQGIGLTHVVLDRFDNGQWFDSSDLNVPSSTPIFDLIPMVGITEVEAGQNVSQFQADGVHITAQSAGQDTVHFNENAIEIPPSAAIDRDGDCRSGTGHDIGADER